MKTSLIQSASSAKTPEMKKQMSAADAYGAQMVKKRISMYAKGATAPSFNNEASRGVRKDSKEIEAKSAL